MPLKLAPSKRGSLIAEAIEPGWRTQ